MSYTDKVIERREEVKVEMDAILEAVATEDRTDLTDDESAKVELLANECRSLDEKIVKLQEKAQSDAKLAEARAAVAEVAMPKQSPAKVIAEARTYSSESSNSFVVDAYNAQTKNDYLANERLARHMREESIERRDVGTAAFEGLVVPQYLTDLAAPLARAGRPFLDGATSVRPLPPSGMTINISRMTTGTATAIQATENAAVQETDADDTLLTVNVRTIAGQQDISRQALERGTGIDSFIIGDLIRAWHTNLDNQCLNGAGTSGTILGLDGSSGNAITYTSASPTAALLWPKLADAINQIQTNSFMNPTHWVMHPRRIAYLLAAVDGQSRPLLVPNAYGPMNAMGVGNGSVQYGNSGYTLMGLPVISDANVTTTDSSTRDKIYCVTSSENHLWEQPGSPFSLRFDATGAGNLTVKTVVYGYAAYTAGRYPTANSIIAGTGLAAPTF